MKCGHGLIPNHGRWLDPSHAACALDHDLVVVYHWTHMRCMRSNCQLPHKSAPPLRVLQTMTLTAAILLAGCQTRPGFAFAVVSDASQPEPNTIFVVGRVVNPTELDVQVATNDWKIQKRAGPSFFTIDSMRASIAETITVTVKAHSTEEFSASVVLADWELPIGCADTFRLVRHTDTWDVTSTPFSLCTSAVD